MSADSGGRPDSSGGTDLVVTTETNGQQLLVGGEAADGSISVAVAVDHDDDLSLDERQDLIDDLREGMRRLVGCEP